MAQRVECPYCYNFAYPDAWDLIEDLGDRLVWWVTYTCVGCMMPHRRKEIVPKAEQEDDDGS